MLKKINHINGIPLHYARLTHHPYGTRGEQRSFLVDEQFLKTLEKALEEVFDHCPFGVPEVITTAGVLVNKPGEHRRGKAFDLDAVFWDNHSLVALHFLHQKELYLGIESFLRKHFGIVLNYRYPNHKDHWHIDISVPVDFNKRARSETLYVQMVLKYIYDEEVLVDGLFGKQTQGAINTVFNKLRIPTPITTRINYLKFLDLTGKIAFELSKNKNTPLQLLDNLTEVLKNLPVENKNSALEAFNSFIDHNETALWLDTFESHTHRDIDTIITDIVI